MTKTNKLATLLAVIMGLALLAPGGAAADTMTIQDNTWMQPWVGSKNAVAAGYPSWNWRTTPIADNPNDWLIQKVNVTWSSNGSLLMQIYTNYSQAGADNGLAGQADIALDRNRDGIYETGIKMSGSNLGAIYAVSSWRTPQDIWGNGSWIYTGRYDTLNSTSNPRVPYTAINGGSVLGQASVNWQAAPGSGSNWVINVLFPTGFNSTGNWNNFSFMVESGTCANDILADTATNPVPIPASFVLFASGVLGLALLTRKVK